MTEVSSPPEYASTTFLISDMLLLQKLSAPVTTTGTRKQITRHKGEYHTRKHKGAEQPLFTLKPDRHTTVASTVLGTGVGHYRVTLTVETGRDHLFRNALADQISRDLFRTSLGQVTVQQASTQIVRVPVHIHRMHTVIGFDIQRDQIQSLASGIGQLPGSRRKEQRRTRHLTVVHRQQSCQTAEIIIIGRLEVGRRYADFDRLITLKPALAGEGRCHATVQRHQHLVSGITVQFKHSRLLIDLHFGDIERRNARLPGRSSGYQACRATELKGLGWLQLEPQRLPRLMLEHRAPESRYGLTEAAEKA